ncbi:MAG: cobyric acid synthase [Burkholderiaceae bacterium]
MTRFVMCWGTSSGAGKSWLATALCRVAARRGIDVRPFKAQNMSNNARVVAGLDGRGAEIGAAQWFQALAAGVEPTVDMNPVLLKPERDTASQAVVHGRVDAALSRQGWRERSAALAGFAAQSLARLAGGCELVVIEGAGSPAEINLAPQDYVNLGTARQARGLGELASLLVADIDRGGAFAHLYGTWALLPADLRPTLRGFVLNRFRGDAALLEPGPAQLQQLTGVPLAGTLPMVRDHGLPDEDGVHDAGDPRAPKAGRRRVAVIAGPHLSNLDEFEPLRRLPGVQLAWVRGLQDLGDADWIVLPGSKQVSGDLAWLRAQGLDAAVARHAAAGRPVLGVCGGLQMLGEALVDPEGHDGEPGFAGPGLGLLPLVTRYEADKRVRRARLRFESLDGPWAPWAGREADGYEIHCGVTVPHPDMAAPTVALRDAGGAPIGWQRGCVLGVYAHGLLESPALLRALFGASVPALDASFDRLADLVERHLDARLLSDILGRGPRT